MSYRADRAQALLDALDRQEPVKRMLPPPLVVRQVLCRECQAQITLARLPSGNMAPLDRHPVGELVIVNGCAVTRGEHHADAPRYVLHFAACRRETQQKKENT